MTEIAEIIRKAEAEIAALSGHHVTIYYRTRRQPFSMDRIQSSIDSIILAVSTSFGCDIMRQTRKHQITDARNAAWHIIRRITPATLVDIGRMFKRDHSTIIHGIRTCSNLIATEPDYAAKYNEAKRIIEGIIA